METALAGVAFVVLGLLWAVITAIPLFLFGFCLHKCFTWFSESFRNTRIKRLLFPSFTGLAFVVAGLVTHAASLDLTGPSGQAKLSLFFSALLFVVDLPLILVCIVVGIWQYRSRRRAQTVPHQ
jgi:fucose 4-O-acetylase-like acetyltransferase